MKQRWWKYSLYCLGFLVILGLKTSTVNAAGSVSVTADKSAIAVDEEVVVKVVTSEPADAAVQPEITITYDKNVLEFKKCSTEYGGGGGGLLTVKGTTTTITFVGKAAGTGLLSAEAVIDEDGNQVAKAETSIAVKTGTSGSKSSDVTLKKLTLSKGTFSPAFSPDVLAYTIQVPADVESIAIDAVATSQTAKIVEASGFSDLQNGTNQASIKVKAEDGTTGTYTFEITKTGEAVETVAPVSGNTISIENSDLVVNTTFPSEMLPEGCVLHTYTYKEQAVDSAYFEMGNLILLYLSNADGSNGGFYIYYSGSDEFMEFVQIKGIEGKFIFPVQYVTGIPIPDGFVQTTFQWGEQSVDAYMVSEEISANDAGYPVLEDTTEPTVVYNIPAPGEYYLFFAMSSEGNQGWYLYDTTEGTYQRYLEVDTDSVAYDDTAYLSYKQKSQTRMLIICIISFVVLVLSVVVINMFLKIKELSEDELDDEEESQEDEVEQKKKTKEKRPEKEKKPEKVKRPEKEKRTKKEVETEKKKKPEVKKNEELEKPLENATENTNRGKAASEAGSRQRKVVMVNLLEEEEKKEQARLSKERTSLDRDTKRQEIDDDFEFEFINISDD